MSVTIYGAQVPVTADSLASNGNIYLGDANVYFTSLPGYRGFQAQLNQFWGNDPSINQIVLSNGSDTAIGQNATTDTNDDNFYVTGLTGSDTVATVNLYGSEGAVEPIPLADVTAFVESFVDNILYNGTVLRTSVASMQAAFNVGGYDTLVASMPVGTLFTDFEFYMVQAVVDTTGMPNTGSGTGAVFSVFVDPVDDGPTYVDGTVICLVSGTGYAPGDVITVPGTALRGISPGNDMTITVATINLATGIESFNESGNINVTAYPVWFVNDGGSDQYDWGNYLGTSATRCEFTASTDATSYLIVTDVAYGTLATGQSVYFEDNGQSSTILWQLSGTPGGVGTYICGGYNTPIPNQSSLTRYAVGIDYKVNAVDNVNAQFGVGSEYGSMYGDAIFAMVGTGASISAFYYAGETGSDGQGNKLVTSPLIATGGSLNLNVVDQNWKFAADGSLTFPDNTVQTTAYTGSAATGYTLTVGDINTSFTNFDVVTVDSAGNTYYLGHTTGLTPGNSPFIIKVDSSGSVSWQTTLLYDGVVTAAVTFETTMILTFSDGDTPSQTWIVYINTSTGQVTNSYYYVVTVETIKVRDLVLGVSGGVPAWESAVGYFNSGTGGENSALIYFSSIGPSWTYSIAEDGAVGAVEYYGTATDPVSANVYAVGSSLTYGSVVTFYTPAGDLQWHKNIDLTQPLTITATSVAYSNGYIYVVSNNTDNTYDGFITKLDAITGAIIWQNGMGYGLTGDPFGIADGCVTIDGNGDIITAWNYGSVFSQGMDILVVKFDTNGSVLWQRAIGTAGDEYHNVGDATEFLTADSSHYYIAMSAEDNGFGSLGGALQLPLDGSGVGSYGNWLYSTQSWTVDPQDITGGSVDITANLIATPITLTQSGDQGAGVTNATLPTTLNLIGGGITTGDVTFDGINIIGTGNLHLQPDSNNNGAYLDIYLTTGPDMHIAGNGETVIIGRDSGANVSVNINGNVTVRADSGTPHVWAFGNDGNLTLPAGGTINYSDGSNALVGGGGGVTNQLVNSNYAFTLESNGNLTLPPGGNINAAPTVDYGDGNSIVLTAGSTTGCVHVGGSVILNAGSGGASGGIERGGNILLNTNSGTWAFGNDGNLTLPATASITNATSMSIESGTNLFLRAQAGGVGIYSGNSQLSTTSGLGIEAYADSINLTPNAQGDVLIDINNTNTFVEISGPVGSWMFTGDGNLTLPSSGNIVNNGNLWQFGSDGNLTLPAGGQIVSASNTGNVVITASDGVQRTWTFEGGGNLTLPAGGTINYSDGSNALVGGTTSPPNYASLTQSVVASAPSGGLGGAGSLRVTVNADVVSNSVNIGNVGFMVTALGTGSGSVVGLLAEGTAGTGDQVITINGAFSTNQTYYVSAFVTSQLGTTWSEVYLATSGICLIAGTMITLADGTKKAIENITYSDTLLAWDFDQGKFTTAKPLWIKQGETGGAHNRLTFSDGTVLRTFDQHRIFNKQWGAFTYPMTDNTPLGTLTFNEHGDEVMLVNKEQVFGRVEYYNVITDRHINLFSDSILTSCRLNNAYPIVDMQFNKSGRTLRDASEFAGIDARWIAGLRLCEQTYSADDMRWYVARLERLDIAQLDHEQSNAA